MLAQFFEPVDQSPQAQNRILKIIRRRFTQSCFPSSRVPKEKKERHPEEYKMPREPSRDCLNLFRCCLPQMSDLPDTHGSQAHQEILDPSSVETTDDLELQVIHGPAGITIAEPPVSPERKTAQDAETRVDHDGRPIENTGLRTGSKLEAGQPSTVREMEITKDMKRPSAQRPGTAKNTEAPAPQEMKSSKGTEPAVGLGTRTTQYTKHPPEHKRELSNDLGSPGLVVVARAEETMEKSPKSCFYSLM